MTTPYSSIKMKSLCGPSSLLGLHAEREYPEFIRLFVIHRVGCFVVVVYGSG
jgi:hypothetical protein